MNALPDRSVVVLPWHWRLALCAGGLVAIGLLATAATLRADSRGYGTHQQLGLPPCTFQQVFARRCPSCGMTTAWAYVTRGRLVDACRANVGGTLLAMLAATAGPWILISGLRGSWLAITPNEWSALIVALTIVTVTLVDWCVRLAQ